jgi:anti-sigma factor RsiW
VSCQPERVTGVVDGVLDPTDRAEMEAHLKGCPECRRQAEEERELRRRLRSLPPVGMPSRLEDAVRARLRREARPRRWRWAVPAAAALLLAFQWLRAWPPFLGWELARDHDHCWSRKELPAEVVSGDPEVVAARLSASGASLPRLPAAVAGLELVGARRCPLADRSVAHVYYASPRRRASLFVVGGPVRLRRELRLRALGNEVLLARVGGDVVGVVSENKAVPSEFLAALTRSVAALAPAARSRASAGPG